MSKITSKFLMTRLCLVSCILLSMVFTSENAFSIKWKDTTKEVTYNPKKGEITIKLQAYYYHDKYGRPFHYNHISDLELQYSVDGKAYTSLLSAEILCPGDAKSIWAKLKPWNSDEIIFFPEATLSYKNSFRWLEMEVVKVIDFKEETDDRAAFIKITWRLPKTVNYIKYKGKWCDYVKSKINKTTFEEVVKLDVIKPFRKALKESDKNVKVTCNEGMIYVSNVNSGESIKVYNSVSGAQVTSVVAKGDVVDINLAKNQSYIVKVGDKIIKVAL